MRDRRAERRANKSSPFVLGDRRLQLLDQELDPLFRIRRELGGVREVALGPQQADLGEEDARRLDAVLTRQLTRVRAQTGERRAGKRCALKGRGQGAKGRGAHHVPKAAGVGREGSANPRRHQDLAVLGVPGVAQLVGVWRRLCVSRVRARAVLLGEVLHDVLVWNLSL